jgi:sirohydrochlorin ferrochelatase
LKYLRLQGGRSVAAIVFLVPFLGVHVQSILPRLLEGDRESPPKVRTNNPL